MITSPSNPKLRYVQNLSRRAFRAREGRMLLEGVRLIEEALLADRPPSFVLASEDLDTRSRGAALRTLLTQAGVPLLELSPALLREVSDTRHSQGVLAVVPIPELELPQNPSLILLLDALRDPGNLGTILRTASAAGIDAVLLAPGSVDRSNPKVVRAAMGAHFQVPLRQWGWDAIDALLADIEPAPAIWLADAEAAHAHTAVDWRGPSVLIIGGEAEGASPEGLARATGRVNIPMPGRAESLNAASATAVILFEALRQRA